VSTPGHGSTFRDSEPHDPRLEPIVESFLARHRRGEKPSIAEYTREHPELAARLARLLPVLLSIEDGDPGASGPPPAELPPGEARLADGLVAERLGEYRILRELGRGGMGVVYEAEQESLGRRVALKVLSSHLPLKDAFRERFRREARAAAALDHPHIVTVHGAGESRGVHYYAMQLVEGEGLDKVLTEVKRICSSGASSQGSEPTQEAGGDRRLSSAIARSLLRSEPGRGDANRLPGSRVPVSAGAGRSSNGPPALAVPPGYFDGVARLGAQAAGALAYAHEQGILHRDIKPPNLLLDTRGNVLVADFGLAKVQGLDDLTQTGDILGTLLYMAPEQLRGAPDRRSDVYSLGLSLYELLTLEPPFKAGDRGELVRKVLEEDPVPLRTLNPRVSVDLETIVEKAIAKAPEARYQGAAELARDLQGFLNGSGILARRSGGNPGSSMSSSP
jgi:serine/threonine protein kinase